MDRSKKTHLRELGGRLRKRRFEMDLSQLEVALDANCNVTSYGEIERGNSDPSYTMIIRLAKALLISPKDLMPE